LGVKSELTAVADVSSVSSSSDQGHKLK